MEDKIGNLIDKEEWSRARDLIRAELKRDPSDHWLLTRLSLTYYEEREYKTALKYSERALSYSPDCPLVLWDYAGALEMNGYFAKAIKIYHQLIDRDVDSIAYGECGEGRAWARGLVSDCWFRISGCEKKGGNINNAIKSIEKHISLRGPGCHSIYKLCQVRKKLKVLKGL